MKPVYLDVKNVFSVPDVKNVRLAISEPFGENAIPANILAKLVSPTITVVPVVWAPIETLIVPAKRIIKTLDQTVNVL